MESGEMKMVTIKGTSVILKWMRMEMVESQWKRKNGALTARIKQRILSEKRLLCIKKQTIFLANPLVQQVQELFVEGSYNKKRIK